MEMDDLQNLASEVVLLIALKLDFTLAASTVVSCHSLEFYESANLKCFLKASVNKRKILWARQEKK